MSVLAGEALLLPPPRMSVVVGTLVETGSVAQDQLKEAEQKVGAR